MVNAAINRSLYSGLAGAERDYGSSVKTVQLRYTWCRYDAKPNYENVAAAF